MPLGDGSGESLGDGSGESDASPLDDLLSHLAQWQAAQQVSEAASGRARARELLEQSASTGTWVGLLVDLAEGSTAVVVSAGNLKFSGRLVGVARDFITLEAGSGRPNLLRIDAIESISPTARTVGGRQGLPNGARIAAVNVSLSTVLDLLCSESAPVIIKTSAATLQGTLEAVGEDVVAIRGSGRGLTTHIRAGAIIACEIC